MRTHEDVGELVVTPEQLKDGHPVRLSDWSAGALSCANAPYDVLREFPDGNFLVKDPRVPTNKEV